MQLSDTSRRRGEALPEGAAAASVISTVQRPQKCRATERSRAKTGREVPERRKKCSNQRAGGGARGRGRLGVIVNTR